MATTRDSFPTPSTSSASLPREAATTHAEPSKNEDPPSLPREIVPPRPDQGEPLARDRSRKNKTVRKRWVARYPGCAEALKMLTLRPIFATPVPRLHVETRGADGSHLVFDRATSEKFVVYSPRFVDEFRAGHHAGQWYLRAATDCGTTPQSLGFATAGAAVGALRAGAWRLAHSRLDQKCAHKPCRIFWS